MIFLVSALTVAGILVFTSIQEVSTSPRGRGGGRRRGGGSRGGGSRSGGSRGGSNRGGSSRFGGGGGSRGGSSRGGSSRGGGIRGGASRYGSGSYRPKGGKSTKSFAAKHWKKAAAFGAGAYVGHKISKVIETSFSPDLWNYEGYDEPFVYTEWDRYARIDGWVCRSENDCTWIDRNLGCDDREFDMNSISANWPFKDSLEGRCTCENGFWFDINTGSCIIAGKVAWLIAVIVMAVITFSNRYNCTNFYISP